ncbi:MAG TPA: DUF4382 domain-containing protein [Gemmatimonadaceae bacterium]|nr:DUF4382 domain-containing protein [Gemmatimonadaceae bacterium]
MRSFRAVAAGVTGVLVGAGAMGGCSDGAPTSNRIPAGQGVVVVRLTDAPFPFDEVESVDAFVVRIDARLTETTESEAAVVDEAAAEEGGWVTIAEPNASFDLLTLRGGNTANLGQSTLLAGDYRSLRLILDVDQSSITLKDGTILTGTSSPSILFPSAGHTGIKILLNEPVSVEDGSTTNLLIDFDVGESFIMRGTSLQQNGLLFKPVVKATVQEPAQ